ncbi:M50 family metallopeptidase [Micropruina sp.]|uniref:M50 family metallopeptidase n=1 Tax=Micropruina sp. TaxID=2737536 RepID=UPI0039E64A0E
MLRDIWLRATTVQPPLPFNSVLLVAAVALLVIGSPVGYRLVRHLITLVHEAGHALVAKLCGRTLRGIRLHSDTSGVTLSKGRPTGPGMVATLAAGYPAPSALGLVGALVLGHGYASALLWTLVVACAGVLLLMRNLYGLWVVLAVGVSVTALSWLAPAAVLVWVATALVWALLLAAPRSVIELQLQRRRGRGGGSDVDQLARLTRVPAPVWVGVFLVVGLGALTGGGWLLLGL